MDNLSEEEAARWLEQLKLSNDSPVLTEFGEALSRPLRVRSTNPDALLALLKELRTLGPSMSEEEWTEFATALDSHRPHRPLFADALHSS